MGFTPANFTVNVGDTVSFEVIDAVDAHEVAFNSSGEFDSARKAFELLPYESLTFSTAISYPNGTVQLNTAYVLRGGVDASNYQGGFVSSVKKPLKDASMTYSFLRDSCLILLLVFLFLESLRSLSRSREFIHTFVKSIVWAFKVDFRLFTLCIFVVNENMRGWVTVNSATVGIVFSTGKTSQKKKKPIGCW